MSTMSDQIAKLSKEQRAALEKILKQRAAQQQVTPTHARIEHVDRSANSYPLSSAEQRLWFLDRFSDTGPAFNLHAALDLRGPLNRGALAAALDRLVNRHEILRTRYVLLDGQPRRRLDGVNVPKLEHVDLSQMLAPEQDIERDRLIEAHANQRFHLEFGGLLSATLLTLNETHHVLMLAMHHIISDAWSMTLLMNELWDNYAAVIDDAPPLPSLSIQYLDYAAWQQQALKEPRLRKQLQFWQQRLQGAPDLLELPTDYPRPAVQTFSGDEVQFRISDDLLQQLKQSSKAANVTLFMITFAAYVTLLHRWSGQTDLVIGTDVANRNTAETEPLLGFFVNQLALRVPVRSTATFAELLQEVRAMCLDAFANQDAPFNELIDSLQIPRDTSRTPLYQAKFMLQNTATAQQSDTPLKVSYVENPETTSQFDLLLALRESIRGGILGSLRYRTDLFGRVTAERLVAHYNALLEQIAFEPNRKLADITWLSPAERALLASINDSRETISEPLLPNWFRDAALLHAGATAIVCGDMALTYADLKMRVDALASHLLQIGVTPEQPIAVCMGRSIDMLVALLAVLQCGACYVPLDPDYGAERIAYMVKDCGAQIALCDYQAVKLPEGVRRVELNADWFERFDGAVFSAWPVIHPEQLAYIIYTSGSTGRPKGVAVRHKGLCNFLASMQRKTGIGSKDGLLAVTTISFDIAGLELYLPIITGARVILATRDEAQDGRRLRDLIKRHDISILQATPSTWRMVLQAISGSTLNVLGLCGGEGLPQELALALIGAGVRLVNVYGPTETTIWSSLTELDAELLRDSANAPLGLPIFNTTLHVLNDDGHPVPVGVPGELCIGGDGLARGYCNKPHLTAAAFLPDPYSSTPGARLYRTGDLVRWLTDGRLSFLGRIDHQVKIRGHRIELGEIESVFGQFPTVDTAVVVTRQDSQGAELLVAFLKPRNRTIDVESLNSFALNYLPAYMLPGEIHQVDTFPMTMNGKIDRKALAAMAATAPRMSDRTASIVPEGELACQVGALWKSVLGLDAAFMDQDFFRCGGHSLLAVQLLDQIERNLGVSLPLPGLFKNPTLAGLVDDLAQALSVQESSTSAAVLEIKPDPDQAGAPFPLTSIQQAYWLGRSGSFDLGNIATQNYLEIDITNLDPDRFTAAWNQLVARHGMLRAVFASDGTQRILPTLPHYEPQQYDLRAYPDSTAFLLDLRHKMKRQILPADRGPLFDLRFSRIDETQWRVHFCIDMLISDVVSNHILFAELGQLYHDAQRLLAPLSISFRDYVLAEQALLVSPRFERAKRYWLDRLPSFPGRPDLPLASDPSRLSEQLFSRRRFTLDALRWQALKARGQTLQVSPTVLVLTVFSEILGAWSKDPRFALNLTLFNRLPLHADVDSLVGDFTSSLLLACEYAPERPFTCRAQALQQRLWQDLEHKLFSGVDMIRELARARGGAQGAAMPVVFTSILGLETQQQHREQAAQGTAKEGYSASQTSQVWLDHQVAEQDGGLTLVWDALDAVFPDGMLDEMLTAYRARLCELADHAASWATPSCVTPAAQIARRQDINHVPIPTTDDCLHQLFERQVLLSPSDPAIITSDLSIDYQTLNRWSNALACRLVEAGAKRGDLVAIVMHKGWEQVVAAMAINKAGAAYMPVDADLPDQRKAQVIQEGGAHLALIQPGITFQQPDLTCISLDAPMLDALPAQSVTAAVGPDDIAYVIFTSGSTGKPKGVVIDHRGAVNTVRDINQRFDIRAGDRVLALSSLSFDLSVYDIYGMLAIGGALVLPDHDRRDNAAHWWECVERFHVTVWNTVPALMQLLVEHCERLQTKTLGPLRVVMMSGDWIPVSLPDRIRALATDAAIYSLGGATEASIWSIYYPISEPTSNWRSVPYGRPLGNQSFHVLDSAMHPRPDGVTGPLYIGGIGLAKGYWRDPVRTAQSFVPGADGAMLYRTGDLGRYLPDGNIEFLGREDAQVKVQGYRIELGDIEAALQGHPSIAQAAVNAIGEHQDSKTLVAYVVPKQNVPSNDGNSRIQDPAERTLFKLEQRGVRRFDASFARVRLDNHPLNAFLQGLRAHSVADQPLPKYRYASAASLYPVQVYLDVPAASASEYKLEPGAYYYLAPEHSLVKLASEIAPLDDRQSSIRVSLIADLDAIEPLYGESEAKRFCILEAGYLAAVLRDSAAGIGRPLSMQWSTTAVSADSLPNRALHLGQLFLGAAKSTPPLLQSANQNTQDAISFASQGRPSERGWIPLPAVDVLSGAEHVLQRQSFRRFAARGTRLDQIANVLALAHVRGAETLLHVLPGQELASGWYRYEPSEHGLEPVTLSLDADALFNEANTDIYRQGAFAVLIHGDTSDAMLAEIGLNAQGLMERCWRVGIGVCPIGALRDLAAHALRAITKHEFLHAFVAGAIDAEQLQTWEPNASTKAGLNSEQLADYLSERLPAYMVPRVFVGLASLPLSANGKVDRKALPKPDLQRTERAFEAPATDTEQLVAALWCQLLKIDQVGRHDSFFDLGGNSLVAMQLASRLRIDHGIELSIRQVFENPTLSALCTTIEPSDRLTLPVLQNEFLTLRTEWQLRHPPANDHALFPLSLAQQHLFAHQQLDAAATAYNISSAMQVAGSLDPGRLRAAIQSLVDRHEALRARFEYRDGSVWQRVDFQQKATFDVIDFSALHRDQAEERMQEWLQEAAIRPFDLFKGPLMRASLLTIEPGKSVLMLSIHHIVADYLSMEILVDELNRLYAEPNAEAAPLALHFTDAVLWEERFLTSAEAKRQRQFWLQHLQNVPRLEWRDTKQREDGWQSFKIEGALLSRLRSRCREHDLSMFMLGFAALHQLLAHLSGQPDFAIGTPISSRRVPDLEPCVGLLLNTLPIRLSSQGLNTTAALLRATRSQCMQAFEHKDYPCEALQSDLRRSGERPDEALYRVRYVYRRIDASTAQNVAERQVALQRRDAKFDLLFTLNEAEDHVFGEFEYRGAAFSDATIGLLNAQLVPLLTWLADQPDAPITDLMEQLSRIREAHVDSKRKTQSVKLGERLKQIRR